MRAISTRNTMSTHWTNYDRKKCVNIFFFLFGKVGNTKKTRKKNQETHTNQLPVSH